MAQELKIVISAIGKGIKETTGSLVSGLNNGVKAIGIFNKAAGNGNKVASGLTDQIKGLIGAYAGFSAVSNAVQIVKDSETAIYNLQSSVNAANREFSNIGSVEEWEGTVRKLSDELVIYSDTALRNAISATVDMTKRLGLSKEQMEEVIKRSADLGAGKTDLSNSVERVTAALRGEAEASEFLGLTLNETYIKSWHEANNVTEKAWKDLTDVEKAQVRYQVLLEQSDALQGRAAGSAKTFSGAIQLVRKEIDNAVANNEDLVDAMSNLAQVLRDNAGEIGVFLSQLISAAAKVVEFAAKYKELLLVIAGTVVTVSIVSKLVKITIALNAAFTVLTGMGVSAWFTGLRASIAATAASTTALGLAFKGFVIFAAAQGVINIVKAVDAFFKMRDSQKEAKDAQDRLYDSTNKYMEKFKEFKDVKLPEDITGTAPEELEELSRKLAKAKAYWVALQLQLQTKSEKTTFLGTATKEAIAAKAELKVVNQRIKEINSDLKQIKTSGEQAAEGMKKTAEAVKATKEQLDDFEKQAKAAYKTAKAEAEKYAKKVIEWEDKIKTARMSTADKLRELNRKGMTDEEQWNDERLQADEKFYAAKEALRNGDYKLAETLAKDAEGLYAGLAEEIKSSTKDGEDIIVKSLDTTKEVAKDGVQAVGDFMIDLYSEQKDNAKSSQGQWEETAKAIQKQLDDIARDREANVQIKLKDLEAAQNKINTLVKDEIKNIKIKVTKEVTTVEKTIKKAVEAKQTGGPVGFASGGRLPGYGGGDKIKALLEAGEFVIRKEAVAKYGAGFFSKLNSMRLNLPDMQRVVKARIGGLISNLSLPEIPVQRFATGGMAMATGGQSPSETLVVRFQAGDMEAPVKITDPDSRMAIKKMAKEMSRMRLTYAR
ncbi:hypothetical protein [Desulfobacula phenolica]|uniref:Uncharacterized protein n=1 Tax=Desulfobacula phenolica TaxID=90732 RepID=A0A1H2I363_9BACT|nr:hypothetical protein [Desulfobacula phenolica]SDU38238.1 hypothetical protein SAMN04487931_107191 [Desulfobacula phenolica]